MKRKPILIDFNIEQNQQIKDQIGSYERISHDIFAHVMMKEDLNAHNLVYVELKHVFIVCEIRLKDCNILVSDEVFEMWNIRIERLFDDAMKNTELFDSNAYIEIMLHILSTNQHL